MCADFYAQSIDEQARRLTLLATEALAAWPGRWSAPRLLKHRENAVFGVQRDDGLRAALRVHRADYHSDARLRSELAWMSALGEAGLTVPPVLPAACGSQFLRVGRKAVGGERQIDMLGWIDGAPPCSSEEAHAAELSTLVTAYRQLGEVAARVHLQSSGWEPPAGFDRHAWDSAGLIGEAPFWGRFWELASLRPHHLDVLMRARAAAAQELEAIGRSPRIYSMIHADMIPDNLMIDGEAVALLDFDDAGFGWHMFELATALYFCRAHPGYPVICDALFEGYEGVRPGVLDRAQLPLFLFLRGTTYLGWVHTRSETQTAREMTPMLIDMACDAARAYLSA